MTSVKESWKQVGKDLNDIGDNLTDSGLGENVKKFGKDFGKSIVKSVKLGIRTVTEWAANDSDEPSAPSDTTAADAEPVVEEPAESVESDEVPEEKHEIIYD